MIPINPINMTSRKETPPPFFLPSRFKSSCTIQTSNTSDTNVALVFLYSKKIRIRFEHSLICNLTNKVQNSKYSIWVILQKGIQVNRLGDLFKYNTIVKTMFPM